MNTAPISYQRHRFPSKIISHAVWLSHRFGSVANSEMVRNTMGVFPHPRLEYLAYPRFGGHIYNDRFWPNADMSVTDPEQTFALRILGLV
jgi:hypothetical protein